MHDPSSRPTPPGLVLLLALIISSLAHPFRICSVLMMSLTSRCQGLFQPHPFFKGKALGTRLIKFIQLQINKLHSNYTNLPKPGTEIVVHAYFSEIARFFSGNFISFYLIYYSLNFFFFLTSHKFFMSTLRFRQNIQH